MNYISIILNQILFNFLNEISHHFLISFFFNSMFYRTPLHAAVKGGNRELISLVYSHDKVDVNALDEIFF